MAQALGLPSFPPASPWELYTWYVIFLPLAARLLLVALPFLKAMANLKPHGGWILKRVTAVPGLRLLILDSALAFVTPLLCVVLLRTFSDPLGWPTWAETPPLGFAILVSALLVWVAFDFVRVVNSRTLFQQLAVRDFDRLRWQVDAMFAARGLLVRVGTLRLVRQLQQDGIVEEERRIAADKAAARTADREHVAAEQAKERGWRRMLRRGTGAGGGAAGAAGAAGAGAKDGAAGVAGAAGAAASADGAATASSPEDEMEDGPVAGVQRFFKRATAIVAATGGRVSEASTLAAKRAGAAAAPVASKAGAVAGSVAGRAGSVAGGAAVAGSDGARRLADRVFALPRSGATKALDQVDGRIEAVIEEKRKALAITLMRDLMMGVLPLLLLWLLPRVQW